MLNLSTFYQLQPLLNEYNIPYTIAGLKAVAPVNVSTKIHYDNQLYFSVVAQCPDVLLMKITRHIVWRHKKPSASRYSTRYTHSYIFSESFNQPKYTLTYIYYPERTFASGTSISATFGGDVDALNEISGGDFSFSIVATVP